MFVRRCLLLTAYRRKEDTFFLHCTAHVQSRTAQFDRHCAMTGTIVTVTIQSAVTSTAVCSDNTHCALHTFHSCTKISHESIYFHKISQTRNQTKKFTIANDYECKANPPQQFNEYENCQNIQRTSLKGTNTRPILYFKIPFRPSVAILLSICTYIF